MDLRVGATLAVAGVGTGAGACGQQAEEATSFSAKCCLVRVQAAVRVAALCLLPSWECAGPLFPFGLE